MKKIKNYIKRKINAVILAYCFRKLNKHGFTAVQIVRVGDADYIKSIDGSYRRIGRKTPNKPRRINQ